MKKIAMLLMFAAVLIVSCGKKEVKPVSRDSKTATEAFAVINKIKDAYLKNDLAAIQSNTTPDGFRTIKSSIHAFDSAELSFTPVFVEIEADKVTVNVSWKGSWTKGSSTYNERGMAVFVLKGAPLKVDGIIRATPFRYPD
jgi:hypothetical protein